MRVIVLESGAAFFDHGPQSGAGSLAECQNSRVRIRALRLQSVQHITQVAAGDAELVQLLTGLAGRVLQLGQDGGERGTGSATLDAGAMQQVQRGNGRLQIHARRFGLPTRDRQRFGQAGSRCGTDVRALGEHVGHAPGFAKTQTDNRQRVAELCGRIVETDALDFGQVQHRRQGFHGIAGIQAGSGQHFHTLRRFCAGDAELRR